MRYRGWKITTSSLGVFGGGHLFEATACKGEAVVRTSYIDTGAASFAMDKAKMASLIRAAIRAFEHQ